jgi:lysozyme
MAKAMVPLVVDLSHHNEVEDWGKVYASGIRGVIHKATQGSTFVDAQYASRKTTAKAAGLLWGAYHFGDNSDVTAQVANFLSAAGDLSDTLLVLDFEPNNSNTMSFDQARQFLQLVYDKTGQRPTIYSGNLLKEGLGKKADPFFSAHRLWICEYGPKAVLPPGFTSYWLWQYTGDGIGNPPHAVYGVKGTGIDLNVFGGTDLAAEWCHMPASPAPTPLPDRADATVADLKSVSPTARGLARTKAASAVVTAVSVAAGVTTDTTTTIAPVPTPVDVINVDTLHRASDGVGYVKAIATAVKDLAIAFAINEWVLTALLGIAAFIVADKLLNWHLEDYIYGLWHPKEEAKPNAVAPAQ